MILITGATGNIGTELVKRLSANGQEFLVMVRQSEDAAAFERMPGAKPVIADFEDKATVASALQGVERAFLLTPSSEKAQAWQTGFVQSAKDAGVERIVKQSQLHASDASPVRFLRYHAAVEQAIRGSGMEWTFLRPNLFMQGLLMFADQVKQQGKFAIAAGDAKVSAIDVRDIAAVAAVALTDDEHVGKTYDLTGPQALTHSEMAAMLSKASGREIRFERISDDQMRQMLSALKMPVWMADGLVEDYAHYRRGEAEASTSGVRDALGREPISFATFADDYAHLFA